MRHTDVFALATWSEHKASRKLKKLAGPIGPRCINVPADMCNSGGYAGALVDFLDERTKSDPIDVGTVVTGTRVIRLVNPKMGKVETLWECEPIKVCGAKEVTVLDLDYVVKGPEERKRLYELTGAEVVDMESGVLAREKKLDRILRVISDNRRRPLYRIGDTLKPDGRISWPSLGKAVVEDPARSLFVMGNIWWNAYWTLRDLSLA